LDLTGYKLTFDEEFNTRSISLTGDGTTWASSRDEWRYSTFDIGFGTSAFVDPSSGHDPFKVENGELTITATPDKTAAGAPSAWESGLITTQGNFSQQYGYFEMRADMSNSPGGWDAFWLLPDNPNVNGNPDGDSDWTELDIVEHYGVYNQGTYRWIHTNESEKHPDPNATLQVFSNNLEQLTGYHTYGVKWTPENLEFYFDGQLMGSRPTPSDYHQKMHMIANLAVQGGDLPAGANSPLDPLKIDYIRVYSNDPNAVAAKQDAVSAPDSKDPGLYGATTAGTTTPTTPTTPPPKPNVINGTSGSDRLTGTSAADVINGKGGKDILTGGDGKDTFVFGTTKQANGDTISDFVHGTDRIDLTGIDANTRSSGDQAFTFIETERFHKLAGELHAYHLSDGHTYISGDTNGDGAAEFAIKMLGDYTFADSDFVL
jgi:beta-glucanase (GH16 family)